MQGTLTAAAPAKRRTYHLSIQHRGSYLSFTTAFHFTSSSHNRRCGSCALKRTTRPDFHSSSGASSHWSASRSSTYGDSEQVGRRSIRPFFARSLLASRTPSNPVNIHPRPELGNPPISHTQPEKKTYHVIVAVSRKKTQTRNPIVRPSSSTLCDPLFIVPPCDAHRIASGSRFLVSPWWSRWWAHRSSGGWDATRRVSRFADVAVGVGGVGPLRHPLS